MRIPPLDAPNIDGWDAWTHSMPAVDSSSQVITHLGAGTVPVADKTPIVGNWAQRLHAPAVVNLADYVDALYGGC